MGVIGAGLAGLRCAEILIEEGVQVTIIEARDRLGGRVSYDRERRENKELRAVVDSSERSARSGRRHVSDQCEMVSFPGILPRSPAVFAAQPCCVVIRVPS